MFTFIRDFCDAEAVLLGYSPFTWKEWSFTIEQVQLANMYIYNKFYLWTWTLFLNKVASYMTSFKILEGRFHCM